MAPTEKLHSMTELPSIGSNVTKYEPFSLRTVFSGTSSEAQAATTPDALRCFVMIAFASRSTSDWSLPNSFLDASFWTIMS